MRRPMIDFINKNTHGAWVVMGCIGIRQYYDYTKAQAIKFYQEEYENTEKIFVCRRA